MKRTKTFLFASLAASALLAGPVPAVGFTSEFTIAERITARELIS